jgi:hypothetical protein
MRTLLVIVCAALCAAAMPAPALAGPAWVVISPADEDCRFGWGVQDEIFPPGVPNFVQHPGDVGIQTFTDSKRGISKFVCAGRIEFGAPAPPGTLNLFTGASEAGAILSTQAEACADTGLCPRGGHGATIITGDETGLDCSICNASTGECFSTFDWRQIVSPDGRVLIECNFREAS